MGWRQVCQTSFQTYTYTKYTNKLYRTSFDDVVSIFAADEVGAPYNHRNHHVNLASS